jgi:hypothetical protein
VVIRGHSRAELDLSLPKGGNPIPGDRRASLGASLRVASFSYLPNAALAGSAPLQEKEPRTSFPRKRESTSFGADVAPALRQAQAKLRVGRTSAMTFIPMGSPPGPWTPRVA